MRQVKWYVGKATDDGKRYPFKSETTPTDESHGTKYTSVIGPFKTKRGAFYMAAHQDGSNPHLQTVADAERAAAKEAAECDRVPNALRKPARMLSQDETEIHTRFERDRAHIELRDKRTDQTIIEWWDEAVAEAAEDGFIDARDWHGTAYAYAEDYKLLPTVLPHYVAGWGSHGCLYDSCAVCHNYADAVEIIADTFELGRTRRKRLEHDAYIELNTGLKNQEHSDGADYAEITSCNCTKPWDHDENITEEDWNNA